MDPRFFFCGKLSREESASAFLATLLDQHPDFRAFFYRNLKIEEPRCPREVSIEHHEVDIRMDYPAARVVVLIENKVRPGALQINQLVRYYLHQLTTNSDSRIIVVMVSPSPGTGATEADRLRRHKAFRSSDAVIMLPWRDLREFCDILPESDPQAPFIKGGFASILKMIDDAEQEKYPLEGGRQILHDVAKAAFQELAQIFPGKLKFWRAKELFDIYTIGGDITAAVDLVFEVDNKAPYAPLRVSDPKHIAATLRTQMTLSAKGKRNQHLRAEWSRICKMDKHDIPGLGLHTLSGGRWFKMDTGFSGDAAALEQALAKRGEVIIARAIELERQYRDGA